MARVYWPGPCREAVYYASERLWRGQCATCRHRVSARTDRAIFDALRDHDVHTHQAPSTVHATGDTVVATGKTIYHVTGK